MPKIKLGQRPAAFAPFPVTFKMPDGTEGVITATFKYRTRKEFGELLNKMMEAVGDDPSDIATMQAALDYARLFGSVSDQNAKQLHESLVAWDIDEPLTDNALRELCDQLPAAAAALMAGYSSACQSGRLGN